MQFKSMTIKELSVYLSDSGMTHEQIGKLYGVSRLQVTNYVNSKTKNTRPKVAFRIFENVKVEGLPVLLDMYKNPEHLKMTKEMMEKAEEM